MMDLCRTYASAASLLPPSRDYAMIGNTGAHTKFSVSMDGRVKSGNHSIYTPMERADIASGADGSELLWNPRNLTAFWPATNWSDYKSSVVGRTSRAVTVSAVAFCIQIAFKSMNSVLQMMNFV